MPVAHHRLATCAMAKGSHALPSLPLLLPLLLQDMMSSDQLQKLAELRRQRNNAPQPSSNIVQVNRYPHCAEPCWRG